MPFAKEMLLWKTQRQNLTIIRFVTQKPSACNSKHPPFCRCLHILKLVCIIFILVHSVLLIDELLFLSFFQLEAFSLDLPQNFFVLDFMLYCNFLHLSFAIVIGGTSNHPEWHFSSLLNLYINDILFKSNCILTKRIFFR